jgi:hypothetical protein
LNKRMSWGRTVVCRFDDAHRLSSLEQREKKKKRGVRERCVHPVGFQAKYVREGEGSGLTRRKQGRVVGCAGGQGACCSFAWREVREREVASHPWQYLLRFSISFFPTGSSQPGHCSRS